MSSLPAIGGDAARCPPWHASMAMPSRNRIVEPVNLARSPYGRSVSERNIARALLPSQTLTWSSGVALATMETRSTGGRARPSRGRSSHATTCRHHHRRVPASRRLRAQDRRRREASGRRSRPWRRASGRRRHRRRHAATRLGGRPARAALHVPQRRLHRRAGPRARGAPSRGRAPSHRAASRRRSTTRAPSASRSPRRRSRSTCAASPR